MSLLHVFSSFIVSHKRKTQNNILCFCTFSGCTSLLPLTALDPSCSLFSLPRLRHLDLSDCAESATDAAVAAVAEAAPNLQVGKQDICNCGQLDYSKVFLSLQIFYLRRCTRITGMDSTRENPVCFVEMRKVEWREKMEKGNSFTIPKRFHLGPFFAFSDGG